MKRLLPLLLILFALILSACGSIELNGSMELIEVCLDNPNAWIKLDWPLVADENGCYSVTKTGVFSIPTNWSAESGYIFVSSSNPFTMTMDLGCSFSGASWRDGITIDVRDCK